MAACQILNGNTTDSIGLLAIMSLWHLVVIYQHESFFIMQQEASEYKGWSYLNTNYLLAALIIVKVAGSGCESNLFSPNKNHDCFDDPKLMQFSRALQQTTSKTYINRL
jgi:hypothetical protein